MGRSVKCKYKLNAVICKSHKSIFCLCLFCLNLFGNKEAAAISGKCSSRFDYIMVYRTYQQKIQQIKRNLCVQGTWLKIIIGCLWSVPTVWLCSRRVWVLNRPASSMTEAGWATKILHQTRMRQHSIPKIWGNALLTSQTFTDCC